MARMDRTVTRSPSATQGQLTRKTFGHMRFVGWDAVDKRPYQFRGCHWHSCPVCLPNRTEVDRPGKKTFEELYADTLCSMVAWWKCGNASGKGRNVTIVPFASHFGMLPLEGKKTVSTLRPFSGCFRRNVSVIFQCGGWHQRRWSPNKDVCTRTGRVEATSSSIGGWTQGAKSALDYALVSLVHRTRGHEDLSSGAVRTEGVFSRVR